MFNNVGKTIETLAKIFFVVGIVLSIVGWLILLVIAIDQNIAFYAVLAMIVLVFGITASWVNSVLLFAFGRLVKNSDILVETIATEDEIEDDRPFGSNF